MIWRIILAILFASLFSGAGITILVRLPPTFGLLWTLGLGGAFLAWHVRRDRPRRRALVRLRRPRGSHRLMMAAGASTLLIALGVSGLIELLVSPFHDIDLRPWEQIMAYQRTLGGWIALTAFVALAVPLVEEFCFRGHIQRSLERRLAPWVAVLVTTALFTVVHISPAHSSLLLLPFLLGLGMGIATVLFQSIWVAVAIHAAWNAAMSMGSVLPGDAADFEVGRAGLLAVSLVPLALGLAGWVHVLRAGRYRTLFQSRSRRGRHPPAQTT